MGATSEKASAPYDSDDLTHLHLNPRNAASTVLSVAYGTPVRQAEQNPAMQGIAEFTERIIRVAFYVGPIVEYMPWLQHLPASIFPWKKEAMQYARQYTKMFGDLCQDVKARVVPLLFSTHFLFKRLKLYVACR